MTKPFTGRHMTAILVAGFGIVIAVNLVMARFAVSTFGGVVVENSYVASQEFNKWLDEADRSRALGWKPAVSRAGDGRVVIDFAGGGAPTQLGGTARHPLGRLPDQRLSFRMAAPGRFISTDVLPAGRWTLRLEGRGGEKSWRGEIPLA
ncbi:cytochrome oxidase [Tsuneonella deserti]|uniref:Cytochrome oxidase n=1 Tax=Tsuneonella deserti TaxID=2035528 RepID=A0ABQ1SAQ3_9SPHN|nr:FixH family protein [Tsuneonella deserti]GGE04794.1 cytochrome oxidase [Tsuneonella deserti]